MLQVGGDFGTGHVCIGAQLITFLKRIDGLAAHQAALLFLQQALLQPLFVAIEDLNFARQEATLTRTPSAVFKARCVAGRSVESLSLRQLGGRIVHHRSSAPIVGRFMTLLPAHIVISTGHFLEPTDARVILSLDNR